MLFLVVLTAGTVSAWSGWRWYTTPAPPVVDLTDAEPRVARSIENARAAVQREPRSAEAWGRLGLLLLAHGFTEAALPCVREAGQFDPQNPRWPYLEAEQLLPEQPAAAVPLLRRRLALCRDDDYQTAAQTRLAETLLSLGREEDAAPLLEEFLRRKPDDPRVRFDLGQLACARGDFATALDHLARAADSPFTRRKALAQMAAAYLRLGKPDCAAEYERRAAKGPADREWIDPFVTEYLQRAVDRRSRFQHAESLEARGRLGESVQLLSELVREQPDDHAHVSLGIALAKLGDFPRAESELREALRLALDKVQANYFLSVILYRQGLALEQGDERVAARRKYQQSVASGRKALRHKPDHAFAQVHVGLALQRLGEKEEALTVFRRAVETAPELSDAHLHLGEALAERGDRHEALLHLRLAQRLASKNDPRPAEALARWAANKPD
ncbi:MAG TPA: tetratricopeptide repeat protein [Gemmataceae bacterium]|nr:tetratricopeptide repeat protein [Gemmataceae bacterium]